MQCLARTILVILLIQNSLGQDEEDPGCGDQPKSLNNYMRRLNNAENELERPADPKDSEDPNDPTSRSRLFRFTPQTYYPRGSQVITGGSSGVTWSVDHALPSVIVSGGMMSPMLQGIKYKINLPMEELMQRLLTFFMQWPAIKTNLQIKHTVSFRDVLRAAFECMYPEWGSMKMNMIFGGINDETVLKNLFLAMFPNWPQHQINDIFSPTNTIPLIIRKLLLYLVPDMSQKEINLIFRNNPSVKLILQRICGVLFPFIKSNIFNIFRNGNSVMNIFDGLLQGFFPTMQAPQPQLQPQPQPQPIPWELLYHIIFPGVTYNITSSQPNLPFLLSQYKTFQSMPMEPSKREIILVLILMEWLKQNPTIKYKLPSPGMDDFNNFKFTFFQNAPPNTIVPPEFNDDNFLRELFALWNRIVVARHPNDTQIDLHGILNFLPGYLNSRIDKNPDMPSTEAIFVPTTAAPTMNEIPKTITILYIENLGDLLTPEIRVPLIEMLNLPDKTKSGPLIMRILSDWQKYKLKNRVPLSKLMELILRIIASNWPDVDIERVVGRNLNFEQILINLFKVMFLEWPNVRLDGKMNTPKFILEMLVKKALPHISKPKINLAFGSGNMEQVVFNLMKILFPGWPLYNPSNSNFNPEVQEKILSEIISWPRTKSTIIAEGAISIPLLVESFIHAIFPSWPQYMVSMITVGRTPLPLIVQKIIQLIATKPEDKNIALHYDQQSPMVQISEPLFRMIFSDWPNYSAALNIPDRRERNVVLGRFIKEVYGSIAKHESSLQCLNDRDSNWAFALLTSLLKYVQQECLQHSM